MAEPAGNTRKFANIRSKTTASEMRTKAALEIREKQSQDENSEKISMVSIETTGGRVPLQLEMKIEPTNYEKMVKEKEWMIKDDPDKDLLVFPQDDLRVDIVPRELRTLRSRLPKQAQDPMLPVYLQDIFDFYKSDWTMIHRDFFEQSKYPKIKKTDPFRFEKKKLPNHKFEIDIISEPRPNLATVFQEGESTELQKSEAEPRNHEFLKPNVGIPNKNAEKTPDSYSDMIFAYRELDAPEFSESLDDRPSGSPFKEKFGRRFLVECLSLSVGTVHEPLFGTLALYDLQSKRKISENFHFDTNADDVSDMLKKFSPEREVVSLSRHALFQVNYPNQDIYLVLKVEKILEGAIEEAYERYAANHRVDKLKEISAEFCSRLGKFRQPFLWAAIPLFNKELELDLVEDMAKECSLNPLFRYESEKMTDSELMDAVSSLGTLKGSKKFKTVPGVLKYRIVEIGPEDVIPNCFTPDLTPVKPFENENGSKVVREIEEFPQYPIVHPHTDYVNLLYVYPVTVNFSKWTGSGSARNIAVKVQFLPSSDQAAAGANAMKAIYGKSSSKAFVHETYLPVNFHNKTPFFNEEIKIALPLNLTKSHHLLFTFTHVSCKKKRDKEDETILGYSWLPVFDGRIVGNQEHFLPIALEIEKGYDTAKHLKFMDGKKPLFQVRTKLVSSVFSHDEKLHHFFLAVQEAQKPGGEEALSKAIDELKQASPPEIVQFGPIIFDQLFRILCQSFSSNEIPKKAFLAIIEVVSVVNNEKSTASRRDPSLVAYVQCRFSNHSSSKRHPFEEIFKHWVGLLEENHPSVHLLEKFAWFFFELCIKSAIQYLRSSHGWKSSMIPNPTWFSSDFLKNIDVLLSVLMKEITQVVQENFAVAKELNESIAYFLQDLFPFFERTFIFNTVQKYCDSIPYYESDQLINLKFDFIKIICGHEHYIPLNFPARSSLEKPFEKPGNYQREFWERHFLAGLLLYEVSVAMDNPSKNVRVKAFSVLKDVISKHEFDPRLSTPEKRARVAGIYFPFISILLVHFNQFSEERQDDYHFTLFERRLALICFLYILKNIDKKWILDWLRKESMQTFLSFLELVSCSLDIFQYSGKEKIAERRANNQPMSKVGGGEGSPKPVGSGKGSIRMSSHTLVSIPSQGSNITPTQASVRHAPSLSLRAETLRGGLSDPALPKRKVKDSIASVDKRPSNFNIDLDTEVRLEGVLASEVSSILLEVYDLLLAHQNPKSHDTAQSAKMFSLLSKFTEIPQSEALLIQILGTIKAFIFKFPQAVFKDGNSFCSELCHITLKSCASPLPSVRQYASTLFYLLLKKNFEATKQDSFMKVRVQTTVALSRLNLQEDQHLRRSLATIIEFSLEDPEVRQTKFPKLVKEAADRLFTILRDSVKMNEHQDDSDMLADMHYRIAQGYMNAPDLRLASLETLLKVHFRTKNWAEAAQCLLHSAALVSQCLKTMQKRWGNLDLKSVPDGAKAFTFISADLQEEEASTTEGEGIGESASFSERGLANLLEQAINYLRKAQHFETINEVYKLILPIYEKNKSFEQLSTVHYDLHKDFKSLHELSSSGKRLLGSYFRVGFYGSLFKTLNGAEFIYKEKPATPLSEVSNRFEAYYSGKFGKDNFALIHDSSPVDVKSLNPNIGYVQITFCEPYFTEEELQQRTTYFERNNNLRFFVFETPYTPSGKAHGSVEEQHMRKTILETENSFPYVKRRLRVVNRKEFELSPLEVSIEAISNRVQSLKTALNATTIDAKNLQLILQGSVRLQVNEGPLEIANTFLHQDKSSKYPSDRIERLRDCFRDFLRYCNDALITNRSLVKHNQKAYQEDLESGFEDVKKRLWLYVSDGESFKISMGKAGDKDVLSFISGVEED